MDAGPQAKWASPRGFDEVAFGPGRREAVAELMALPPTDPLVAYRQALVRLIDNDDAGAAALLARVGDRMPVAGAWRLVHAVAGGDLDEVSAAAAPAPSLDPLAVEDAMHMEYANALLTRNLGMPTQASYAHASRAVMAAELLGLRGRLAVLRLERQRQLALLSEADLEEVTVARGVLEGCPEAAAQGVQVHAEALAARGLYREAADLLHHEGAPLDVLAFYSVVVDEGERVPWAQVPRTPLASLASSLQHVADGGTPRVRLVRGVDGSKVTTAELIAAFGALRRGDAYAAMSLLSREAPARPDHRFYWAMARFGVLAQTGDAAVPAPFSLPAQAFAALGRMHRAGDVMRLAMRVYPFGVFLLGATGEAPPVVACAAEGVPLLLGRHLALPRGEARVNKRMGEALVIDAFRGDTLLSSGIDRRSRQLYRGKLAELGVDAAQVVPVSTAYRAARTLAEAAESSGRREDVLVWQGAAQRWLAQSSLLRDLQGPCRG